MVFITGDTHRTEFEHIWEFCEEYETTTEDVMVILGDVGINFEGEPNDSELKRELSELPITLLCVHGNHEMRPETIRTYDEEDRFGGVVYMEEEFPNLLFAKCGEIYELDGNRCLVIGGANSIDKHKRIAGVNWWEDEQPSDYIKERVEARLDKEKWRVDVVFTHTCPYKYMPKEYLNQYIKQSHVDNSTERWLQYIEERLNYNEWYCGHFHGDTFSGRLRVVFREIHELSESLYI